MSYPELFKQSESARRDRDKDISFDAPKLADGQARTLRMNAITGVDLPASVTPGSKRQTA